MPIDLRITKVLAIKELRDATRNRWFALYAIGFGGLATALSYLALSGAGSYGVAGFGKTSATLINLVILIVPLMGLTLGALSIAGDRESGALAYVMAQPVSTLEILIAKFIGLGAGLAGALAVGFGFSGLIVAWQGTAGNTGDYLGLVGLAILLALASLSVGLLLSAGLQKSATAIGVSLFLWLLLAFASDLGLMGTAVVLDIGIRELFAIALINPLQVFKMAAVLTIRGDLEVLGPAGLYAVRTYGDGLLPLLIGILALWVVVPFSLGYIVFSRKGAI